MATHFFWDPIEDNIVQERDDTGVITAEYATEPYLYGNLISQNRGGVESQYHFDPQGSTLALTDDNQDVTDTYAYSAFGEVTAQTGSTVNPFQYIGRNEYYRRALSTLVYVRRRSFSPSHGNWSSLDPADTRAFISAYVYADNCPLGRIDPSGLEPVVAAGPTVGFATVYVPRTMTKCAAWKWEITWVINNPRKVEKGAIIQKLTLIDYNTRNCKDEVLLPAGPALTLYCEVWTVRTLPSGAVVISPSNEDVLGLRNNFADQDTYGNLKFRGEAVYVPDYEVKDPPWKYPGDPEHQEPAGKLPTQADCELPKGQKIKHTLSVAWDCCCKPPYDFPSTDPEPNTKELTPNGT